MSPVIHKPLRWAAAVLGLLALVACGGGAEPEASSVPQVISFSAPGDQTYGNPPINLVASATSGLTVRFTTSTPSVCTVGGNRLSLVGAGTCTVVAEQPGDLVFAAAAPVSASFAVARAAQSITFVAPGNQNLATGAVGLIASASSGLPVSFASTTPEICAIQGTGVQLLAAGTCTVEANQAGDALFVPAAAVSRSFAIAVDMLPQSLQFSAPGEQTLGVAPAPLAATSSAGLPVSFSTLTAAVCTVEGSTLTLVSAGTCTVVASQPGDATYAAATPVQQSFAVLPAAQTISFTAPATLTLGSTPPALAATATSGLPVAFASTTPTVCTVDGTALSLVAAGTCEIEARQAGDANFAAAPTVTASITVLRTPQTLSFESPGNQTLGTTPPALVASASSGLPVMLTSTTPTVCTVSGTTLTLVAAGGCTIEASQAGDAVFAPATPVSRSFNVAAAALTAQTISFESPGEQTLGTTPAALVASASSGLPVTITSTTATVCTVSGTTLTLIAAGTCALAADQAGDDTYAAAPTVTRSFSVVQASQSITFASPGNQTLGAGPVTLSATASSGLPVSFASTTPAVCTVSGSTLTTVALGSCTVEASQGGNTVFAAAAVVSRTFSVLAVPLTAQTIDFPAVPAQTLGTPPPALVATATSGLPVSFSATTPSVCAVNGSTLTLLAAGTCTIQADQAGDGTFAAAPTVTRSFAVNQAGQTISFTSPGNQVLGTAPPPLVATATSGLPVSFSTTTPLVCSVSGSTLSLVAAGTCTVRADQAGNGTFAAAPTITHSFAVSQATQMISFTSPGDQTLGTAPPALVATATSGLPVSIASTTPAVCTVSGTTLTLVATGTCTLQATQPGDTIFAAAPPVGVSFSVAPAPAVAQSITFASPGNQTLGTAPPALVATATSGLPVTITSATTAVCTVSGSTLTLLAAGTCTLDADQAGNLAFLPAPTVTRSFDVSQAAQTISFAGPGPQVLGTAPPALVATATSGLTVTITSTTLGVCTVSGTTLTLVTEGTCTLEANQPGNTVFAPAPTVTVSFDVGPEPLNYFANGGFESAGATTPAESWRGAANGYTRSTDARSGAFSAQLSSAAFGAAVMVQNSVDDGGRPPLVEGQTLTLRFWAKGFAGTTGNVLFSLRYLDGVGNILANSMNVFFQDDINPDTWTEITFNLGAVPAGAVAAFIEFSQAIGPIDPDEEPIPFLPGRVLIDDLSLRE